MASRGSASADDARARRIASGAVDLKHRLAPWSRGSINSTHTTGTHVRVEEPSTASERDIGWVFRSAKRPHHRRLAHLSRSPWRP
jgi:hypothetical protein